MDSMTVVPGALEAFNAAHTAASTMITTAGSANSSAMMSAAATAIGPIGAIYLAAYGPAQASNLAGTLLVGGVHMMTGVATEVSKQGYVATDSVDL